MKHQNPKLNKDSAYDGYALAINSSPMLKNSSSGRRLAMASGVPMFELMRNLATKQNNNRRQKAEEERLRADERIAELQQ
jgi:hypothetical protein